MRGKTASADDALRSLNALVAKHTKEIVLKTGDVLVMNNHRVIHGRKPFQPRYDGTDRWLMRLLVKAQLPEKSEYLDVSYPVITTEFASV
jgi:alpha-ketoglutarate-dependent taurine dioxygenase